MRWMHAELPHRSRLQGQIWEQRQRWLLRILWLHVAGLAIFAAARGHPAAYIAARVLPIAAVALFAHLRSLSPRARSVLVCLGLLGASTVLRVVWAGETGAELHGLLVIVVLMLYEDWTLLLLAIVFLGADDLGRAAMIEGTAGVDDAAVHALFALAVGIAGIVVGQLSADLRDSAYAATQRFRSSFDNAPIGMAIVSPEGSFVDVNPALSEILGYDRETLLTRTIQELALAEDPDSGPEPLRALLRGRRRTSQRQQCFLHAAGHPVWISLSLSRVSGSERVPAHLIAQFEDITERKHGEAQLRHLADHDPLTGLLNRRRLEQEIDQQIALAQRYGRRACLLLLDLDNFKSINDSLGHAAGDELLIAIADILRARVRRSDMVARLGGDEFAILLPQAALAQARRLAQSVARAIRERALITGGHELRTTASIGIAAIDPEDSRGLALLRADRAMYDAKDAGRDGIVVAVPSVQPERGAVDR